MSLLRAALVLAATTSTILAIAQSPVGTWNGHASLISSPKETSQEKMRMSGMSGALSKMHIALTIKGNHTYTAVISGVKGMSTPMHEGGKWSQSGNTISLTNSERPDRSQKFTISKGGKQMTHSMMGFTVVFTR